MRPTKDSNTHFQMVPERRQSTRKVKKQNKAISLQTTPFIFYIRKKIYATGQERI